MSVMETFEEVMEKVKEFAIEYPKSIVQLLKEPKKIEDRFIKAYPDEDWYFSQEGTDAYKNLSSLGQKIHFFFEYLWTVAKSPDCQEYLYRIAFVMANSMVDSSLEFGGYPNILDEDKNPLVHYIKNEKLVYDKNKYWGTYCGTFLCVLHNGTDEQVARYVYKDRPFERLTYCKDNESFTDMYKIERDIIAAFSLGNNTLIDKHDEDDEEDEDNKEKVKEKLSFVPYLYSILPDSDDESVDDTDDEE